MNAFADQWFCTEESSERSNNIVKSCGIGQEKTEALARQKAFDQARTEFHQVCDASSDCVGRYIYSKPLRTECRKDGDGYKCYRMVQFRIGDVAQKRDSTNPGYYGNYYNNTAVTTAQDAEDWADKTVARYRAQIESGN